MIKERGTLLPMVVGIDREGKKHVLPLPFTSDESKDILVSEAKKFFKEKGVTQIVWMSEAWCKVVDKKDTNKPLPRPSLCRDRQEIVVISYLSKSEHIYVSMPINRELEKAYLGKPTIMVNENFQDNLWGDYFHDKLI